MTKSKVSPYRRCSTSVVNDEQRAPRGDSAASDMQRGLAFRDAGNIRHLFRPISPRTQLHHSRPSSGIISMGRPKLDRIFLALRLNFPTPNTREPALPFDERRAKIQSTSSKSLRSPSFQFSSLIDILAYNDNKRASLLPRSPSMKSSSCLPLPDVPTTTSPPSTVCAPGHWCMKMRANYCTS